MHVLDPPDASDSRPPAELPPSGATRPWWAAASVVVLVLGCAAALLLVGRDLTQALEGAGGMALIGGQVARRIVADPGHLPTVVVASAVAVFGAILLLIGQDLPHAAMGAGLAGLIAGEVAGRTVGNGPGRGV